MALCCNAGGEEVLSQESHCPCGLGPSRHQVFVEGLCSQLGRHSRIDREGSDAETVRLRAAAGLYKDTKKKMHHHVQLQPV